MTTRCSMCSSAIDRRTASYSPSGTLICEVCSSRLSEARLDEAAARAHDESAGNWLALLLGGAFFGLWLGIHFALGRWTFALIAGFFVGGAVLYGGVVNPGAVARTTQRHGSGHGPYGKLGVFLVEKIAQLADRFLWSRKPPRS